MGTVVFVLIVCWVDSRWTKSTVIQRSTETSFCSFLFFVSPPPPQSKDLAEDGEMNSFILSTFEIHIALWHFLPEFLFSI